MLCNGSKHFQKEKKKENNLELTYAASTLQRSGTSSLMYVFGQDVTLDGPSSVLHESSIELQDRLSKTASLALKWLF